MTTISRGNIRVNGFHNEEMDFQLMRLLGSSTFGGTSLGELLYFPNRMPDASPTDWAKALEELAQNQKEDGLKRLAKQHQLSAREQLLKACNTYRAAEYYTSCNTVQHRQLGLESQQCFINAMQTSKLYFERCSLPYKDIEIPVYFIAPTHDKKMRKTLMIVSGFDGTMEEEFINRGLSAIMRDYNVIHFAGPGQMDVFRRYPNTAFEPDFEQVVSTVINNFSSRPEVDMSSLALLGVSVGGYFALRAASYCPELKTVIANSPIIDLHAYLSGFLNFDPSQMPDEQDFTIASLNDIPNQEFPAELKARTEQLLIRYGRHSFKNTFKYLKQFCLGDAINQIKAQTLAFIGEAEGEEAKRQFDVFKNLVKTDSYIFKDIEGASTHCQLTNLSFANAVMYDWLDER